MTALTLVLREVGVEPSFGQQLVRWTFEVRRPDAPTALVLIKSSRNRLITDVQRFGDALEYEQPREVVEAISDRIAEELARVKLAALFGDCRERRFA